MSDVSKGIVAEPASSGLDVSQEAAVRTLHPGDLIGRLLVTQQQTETGPGTPQTWG